MLSSGGNSEYSSQLLEKCADIMFRYITIINKQIAQNNLQTLFLEQPAKQNITRWNRYNTELYRLLLSWN